MGDKFFTIRGFPHQCIASGEIAKQQRRVTSLIGAWRNHTPKIFTNFNPDSYLFVEKQIGPKRHIFSEKTHRRIFDPESALKPPLFIKLFMIRQITFGNYPKNFTSLHHHSTVIESVFIPQRRTHDDNRLPLRRCTHQSAKALFDRTVQTLLKKEITATVTAHPQFGKDDNRRFLLFSFTGKRDDFIYIRQNIGNPHFRNSRRYPDKTMHPLTPF